MSDQIKPEEKKPEAVAVAPVNVASVHKYGTGSPDVPQIGLGTTLTITPTSGTAPTTVKIQSLKPPTWSGKDVEVTGMSDTFDTYIPGVPNAGEAEIDILYMHAQSTALYALKNVQATFLITYPDSGSRSFTGWINSFGEEVPLKEKISCKIKVRANTLMTVA